MEKISEAELRECRGQMSKRVHRELLDVISINLVYSVMAGYICLLGLICWYSIRGEGMVSPEVSFWSVIVVVLMEWLLGVERNKESPLARVIGCIGQMRKIKRGKLYVEPIEILYAATLTVAGVSYPRSTVYYIVIKGEDGNYNVVVDKGLYEQLGRGEAIVVQTEKNEGTWSLRMSKSEIEGVIKSGSMVKWQWLEDRKLKDVYMVK